MIDRSAARIDSILWHTALDRRIDRAHSALDRIDWRHALDRRCDRAVARLTAVSWRDPLRRRVEGARQGLEALRRQLDALAPDRVLERGYAVVRTDDGLVVRDPCAVGPGTLVHVTVAEGTFDAQVRR